MVQLNYLYKNNLYTIEWLNRNWIVMYMRNQFFRVRLLSYNKVVLLTNDKRNVFVEIYFTIQQDQRKR